METVHSVVLEFQEVQRLHAGGPSGIRYRSLDASEEASCLGV